MAFYELVYITRPDVSNTQVENVTKKFAELIKAQGGKVVKTEQWGLKSLAYRVKKHRKGYYTMFAMEANGAVVNEVERQMRISDDIIRFLTVRVEEITDEPSVQMAASRRKEDGPMSRKPRPNANPATPAAE